MSRSVTTVSVVLLALALAGGTAGVAATSPGPSTTSTPRPSAAVAGDDGGYDLGNNRPKVTNDGLMVRRRVVIAIHPTAGANLVSLRKELDTAAARAHTSLSNIPRGVLDPALMEPVAPEMTLVLAPGKSLDDARTLIGPRPSTAQRSPAVERYDVASVLVHDLRFTVSSATPAVLTAAIEREGILSDALGNYTTTLGRHRLEFAYTGPLLSDELVESVRAGIARRAHVQPAAVTISPRATTGVGVDMAKEPAPEAPVTEAAAARNHNHSAALPAAKVSSQSSHSNLRTVFVIALAALLILTLVLLMIRRTNRQQEPAR